MYCNKLIIKIIKKLLEDTISYIKLFLKKIAVNFFFLQEILQKMKFSRKEQKVFKNIKATAIQFSEFKKRKKKIYF